MREGRLLKPVESDRETAKVIYQLLGEEASIWLLVLANKGNVSSNAAANYSTYTGAIKSYAKQGGINMDEGDIRSGFKRLKRKEVKLPTGASDTIVINDDRQDYIKLTNVGYTLQTQVQTQPEVRKELRRLLGMEVGEEGEEAQLWPLDVDQEDRAIEIYATSDLPEDTSESFEAKVVAKFECDNCQSTVEHSYTLAYPDEAWSETVQTKCEQCSTKWKHQPGNIYELPRIAE